MVGETRSNAIYKSFCLEAGYESDSNPDREQENQKTTSGGDETFSVVPNSDAFPQKQATKCSAYENEYKSPPVAWRFFDDSNDWIAWGTLAAAALAWVAVWLLKGTLEATRETERLARKTLKQSKKATKAANATTEVAKKATEAQSRPWILIENVEVQGVYFPSNTESVVIVEFSYRIKNHGVSPALGLQEWSEIIEIDNGLEEPDIFKKMIEAYKAGNNRGGAPLAPREDRPGRTNKHGWAKLHKAPDKDELCFQIMILVNYHSVYSTESHYTLQHFWISSTKTTGGAVCFKRSELRGNKARGFIVPETAHID